MRINTNIEAINVYRMNTANNTTAEKSLQKLSSGLRINGAGDDAAGLAISEKMRGQIRGLSQASRNIQDGISLIQTAEGGMNEIHSLLQRGRELSVQAANDTSTATDKNSLQQEMDQLLQEVDRIANTTHFNNINLLNISSLDTTAQNIISGLKSAWLQQSEQLITNNYGLTGDGAALQINIVQGTLGGTLAYVSGAYSVLTGKGSNLSLNIEEADFAPATLPNGSNPYGTIFDDRIIAHELTHAVMSRTMDFLNLPTWFKEGVAEFTSGADERLEGDLTIAGGGTDSAGVASLVGDITNAWSGSSLDYSAGYAAVRFLHSQIKANGGNGIKDLLTDLAGGMSLNAAIAANTAYTDTVNFIGNFQAGLGGQLFLQNMIGAGQLADTDTGAVGGLNADGGPSLDGSAVVPNTVNYTNTPLTGFQVIWPSAPTANTLNIQVAANSGQTAQIALVDVRSAALGLSNIDIVNQAQTSIGLFDSAITTVSTQRSLFGAMQNRLEHTLANVNNSEENLTASESRIRDVDLAKEMMLFTKTNILAQASTSMLLQANQQPQAVLQLLKTG